MEKVGDLMRRLGFREEASDDLKKTLLRSMANRANDAETRRRISQVAKGLEEEQLSFVLDEGQESQQESQPTATTFEATTG